MKHSQIVSRCSVPNYCGSAAFDGVTRAHHPPSPKSARNARIRKVSFVTWSGLSESLLISDRNACFKRCLTFYTPCFLREILLFQWYKRLLCCWIRAYARIGHLGPIDSVQGGYYHHRRWMSCTRDTTELGGPAILGNGAA